MDWRLLGKSMKWGIIASSAGLLATYLVSFAVPTPALEWALAAVGFTSFFSALLAYAAGSKGSRAEIRYLRPRYPGFPE
ncbi:hypothetical protein ACP3TJ_07920 [Desulforudis sp. 1088]|jgi:hypothetical protein|uniref:hypothetical protein n=1 Tax=unclassified Candidatus Desulforudis TaxID=2635950 RepID=UPI0034733CD2